MSHPQRTDLEPTVPVGSDMPTGLRLLALGREPATGEGAAIPSPVAERKPWMPPDFSGSILGGRYRIDRMLGFGGMATVYEAEHIQIEKRVAVKVLNPDYADDREIAGRFLQEARTASKLRHEHIIDITDFGHADGTVFFVMELLEGEDLSTTLLEEGPLAPPRVITIARQICTALAAAHALGIIHRDIKPANCFRISRGDNADFIKVLDFGIAKVATSADRDQRTTGAPLGTPGYMALELLKGEAYDQRVDIYAVGVLMYKLLTNKMPFPALNAYGTLARQMDGEPIPIHEAAPDKEIPEALERLIMKAMARDPGDRFQSAIELLDALDAAQRAIRGPSRSDRQLERDPLDWNPAQPTVIDAPAVPQPRRWVPHVAIAALAGLLALVVTLATLPRAGALATVRPRAAQVLTALEHAPPLRPIPNPAIVPASPPTEASPPTVDPTAIDPTIDPTAPTDPTAAPADETSSPDDKPTTRALPRTRSDKVLRRELTRLEGKIARCAVKGAEGALSLRVRVVFDGPTGKATQIEDMGGGALAGGGACALAEIKKYTMPPAQDSSTITHEFTF